MATHLGYQIHHPSELANDGIRRHNIGGFFDSPQEVFRTLVFDYNLGSYCGTNIGMPFGSYSKGKSLVISEIEEGFGMGNLEELIKSGRLDEFRCERRLSDKEKAEIAVGIGNIFSFGNVGVSDTENYVFILNVLGYPKSYEDLRALIPFPEPIEGGLKHLPQNP